MKRRQEGSPRRYQALLGHSGPAHATRKSAQKRRRLKLTATRDRIKKWKVLRGDLVEVVDGRDKGMQGTVLKVRRKLNRVIVEGVGKVSK